MSAARQPTTDSADLQTAQTPPQRATVSDVLRRYGPSFLRAARNQLEPWEARALRELMQCRTADMGGHHWQCSRCGYNHLAYNTCHNRHCAGCGRERRRQWLERVSQWTLPAPYFHLVFTAPHELNPLIEANRSLLYKLQLRAPARAIHRLAARADGPLGAFQPGLISVLHSWGQEMLRHVHSHHVLAGCGPRLGAGAPEWVVCQGRELPLDPALLADTYRDVFLRALRRLHKAGELKMPGALGMWDGRQEFRRFLAPLSEIRWVVFCGSPEHVSRPDAALGYLARYASGAAIGDARIVGDTQGEVTIRIKDYRTGENTTRAMPGDEFVRRFMLHILPPRFSRIRFNGFLGSNIREARLAEARRQLGPRDIKEEEAAAPPPVDTVDAGAGELELDFERKCPRCKFRTLVFLCNLMASVNSWRRIHDTTPSSVRQRQERSLLTIASVQLELPLAGDEDTDEGSGEEGDRPERDNQAAHTTGARPP